MKVTSQTSSLTSLITKKFGEPSGSDSYCRPDVMPAMLTACDFDACAPYVDAMVSKDDIRTTRDALSGGRHGNTTFP